MLHEILRYFEAQHEQLAEVNECPTKALRLFSLLPNKSGFECSHIKLCNNGLYGLLKRSGMQLPTDGPLWRAAAPEFWRKCFRIEHFETANRHFAGEVLTDGHAVSIVMRKPKRVRAAGGTPLQEYDAVLGLDPGRRDLFTTCSLEGEHLHKSTRSYYDAATYKASNRTIQGWKDSNERVRRAHEELPSRKSSHQHALERHIRFVLPVLREMLGWHMQKPFRKLKLRRYIAGRAALQQMCHDLTSGGRTLIGFGDWSNRDVAGIIKKSPAGPVKKLESELRKHCRVVSVDEFRTSKVHNTCGGKLTNRCRHHHKDGETRTRRVYSVLCCTNSSCSGISMNRDENASRNILQLLLLQLKSKPRPEQFTRGTELREGAPAPFAAAGSWPVHSGIIA